MHLFRRRNVALSVAFALLPLSPGIASEFSQRSTNAKGDMARGEYIDAVIVMEPHIANIAEAPKVLKLFSKDKKFKPGLVSALGSVSGSSTETYIRALRAANLAAEVGLFDASERDTAIKAVAVALSTEIVNKRITLTIASLRLDILDAIDSTEVNQRLLRSSIDGLRGRTLEDHEFQALTDFATSREGRHQLMEILRSEMPSFAYRTAALKRSVARFDPDFAAQRLADTTTRLYIHFDAVDGLIALDLKEALGRSEFVQLEADESKAEAVVTLRQLALGIEKLEEDARTIAYKDFQVDIMKAVFLMPDNATYQFEYVEGGYQYEYAFTLSGESIGERVLRDSGKLKWSECKNQRVVNVFGGAQPAGFLANDQMRSMCSVPSARISTGDVRATIVKKLAESISSSKFAGTPKV